jgi:hypothetical protein
MPFFFIWQPNNPKVDSGLASYRPRLMFCVGSRGRVHIGTLNLAAWSLMRKLQKLCSGSVHLILLSLRGESKNFLRFAAVLNESLKGRRYRPKGGGCVRISRSDPAGGSPVRVRLATAR